MRRPRIYKGPASAYESSGECIREVSIGDGTGALIAVRAWEAPTRPLVQLYRVDPSVRVSVGFDDGYDPIRDLLDTLRACVEPTEPGEDCPLPADLYNRVCAAIHRAEART